MHQNNQKSNKIIYFVLLLFIAVAFILLYYTEFNQIFRDGIIKYSSSLYPATFNSKYDLKHLDQTTQYVYGPIQDDEALFVYSVIRVLRPKLAIECGMGHGYSTKNLLSALEPDAKLYTFDIEILNKKASVFNDSRFKFIKKSQAEFDPNDVGNEKIDLVYMDDGHYFDVNVKFWKRILPYLKPNAVFISHDTGLHLDEIEEYTQNRDCVCEFNRCGWSHCPPERKFINWIIDNYPEWNVINMHSLNIYRHGLTILQKGYKLEMQSTDRSKCKLIK